MAEGIGAEAEHRRTTGAGQPAGTRRPLAVGIAVTAIVAAIANRPWRWPMLAGAAVLLAWGRPRLSYITAEAYPTSFFVSPTGYTARSIAAGRLLFAPIALPAMARRAVATGQGPRSPAGCDYPGSATRQGTLLAGSTFGLCALMPHAHCSMNFLKYDDGPL
jgi:hypothetical protein